MPTVHIILRQALWDRFKKKRKRKKKCKSLTEKSHTHTHTHTHKHTAYNEVKDKTLTIQDNSEVIK